MQCSLSGLALSGFCDFMKVTKRTGLPLFLHLEKKSSQTTAFNTQVEADALPKIGNCTSISSESSTIS